MRNPNKAELLSKLFIIPISEIVEWNTFRAKHDQKQVVIFLNSLYNFYCDRNHQNNNTQTSTNISHPEAGDPVPDDSLTSPSVRSNFRSSHKSDTSSVTSRLSNWLCYSSNGSSVQDCATSCSSGTRFSSLTMTTAHSAPAFPLSTNVRNFGYHNRALAVNTRKWLPQLNTHMSANTSPIFLRGSNQRTHSTNSKDTIVNQDLIRRVIDSRSVDLINEFLCSQDESRRNLSMRVIRAIDSLGRLNHFDTTNKRMFG